MLKLLVIADDFTGALDTGVQFSNRGIQTLVSTEIEDVYDSIPRNIEVLVLNTESRHLSFDKAYDKTKMIIKKAKRERIPFIYKKVDSALRGNISAEIKAVLDTSEQEVIPFLPSYPKMNRVLIDGYLYIDGVLVSESVFANDPYEPVTESNIVHRLEQEAGIKATLVSNCEVPKQAKGVCVFDAETDEELLRLATMLQNKNLLNVTVGCAGFAKIIADQLFPNAKDTTYTLEKPVVVLCGSINPITKKQIDYAEKKNYPRISLSATQLLESHYWESDEGQEKIEEYLYLMANQSLIIFETFNHQTMKHIEATKTKKVLATKDYRFKIGESLGKLTEALWTTNQVSTFLFTGGDTLFQSMEVLGVTAIKPIVEISPGVVLAIIKWNERELQVITKSGGFGEEDLFETLSF